jgi:putative transposase
LILLPKYSPDLNPIEQLFAKLKHKLRKAAKRTADTVCAATSSIPSHQPNAQTTSPTQDMTGNNFIPL